MAHATEPRNARLEAQRRARALRGEECAVQILEPAPPAVDAPPWFADADPVAERIASPYGPAELRWATLAAEDPSLRPWCEDRWLGPYRRLGALPPDFEATRLDLHELAEHLISPARKHANTKIGLRWTLGGFGTPFFGNDAQVRVEANHLIVQEGNTARTAPITTLADAWELLRELAPPAADAPSERPLQVNPAAATTMSNLFGFATSVLEELRYDAAAALEPSRVQLWPEHFDVSIELGSENGGQRAGYGCSPGDAEHAEPYLYVVPWGEVPQGERWQAHGFSGAQLDYDALLAAEDQRALALEFFRGCLRELTG